MSKSVVIPASSGANEVVELKDPLVAAVLAWLVPGLGHLYQGRTAKGLLFLICILSTFWYGLYLSDGKAVYSSWVEGDKRLYYLCQLGAGLSALPALLQTYLVHNGKAPLLGGLMAPPVTPAQLSEWYRTLNVYFDLGTVYTTIAGLLNVLAIFDAWGGPAPFEPEPERKRAKAKGWPRADVPKEFLMPGIQPLVAEINAMWYSLPLIVAISLVYSATRHEAMRPILWHAARLGTMITVFMVAIMAVLAFLSWRL